MQIKKGVTLAGLQPCMRSVLREAERIWKTYGREEGVTITKVTGGVHSAISWHYYGYALDLRSKYFDLATAKAVAAEMRDDLPNYDIIHHTYTNEAGDTVSSHIHAEIGNQLAVKLGVLY